MIRWTILFLIFPSCLLADDPDIKLHKNCLYPTVMIMCGSSTGSGVVVRSEPMENRYINVVATAAHVLKDSHVKVRRAVYDDWSVISGSFEYDAVVFAKDKERDLGVLLFLTDERLAIADWGFDEGVYVGNRIYRIGCGNGQEPRLDVGVVSAVFDKEIRTTVYTIPGDSGSGFFMNYRLVGITRAVGGDNGEMLHGISFLVPVKQFKEWNEDCGGKISFIFNKVKKLPFVVIRRMKDETGQLFPRLLLQPIASR